MQNRRQTRNQVGENAERPFFTDLPRLRSFKNLLNYNILKQLHLTWQRQGPTRHGSFQISHGQYDFLLKHVHHRWQPFRMILDELEIETVRYHNETDRVFVQLETFEARLSRKRPLKYKNQNKNVTVVYSPEIEFKFKFTVMTRAL